MDNKVIQIDSKTPKDKCVYCGKDTEYTKYEPIHTRYHYVECVGQLCTTCYDKVFGEY